MCCSKGFIRFMIPLTIHINCRRTHAHQNTRWQGQKFAWKGNSVGILAEITIIFQHAELCVSVRVRVCERADRLLAESLVFSCCSVCGRWRGGCFKHVRRKSVFSGACRRVINRHKGWVPVQAGNWYQNSRKRQMKMGENNLRGKITGHRLWMPLELFSLCTDWGQFTAINQV